MPIKPATSYTMYELSRIIEYSSSICTMNVTDQKGENRKKNTRSRLEIISHQDSFFPVNRPVPSF